jgi:diguanylate cyclase (GGDEF)-like protein
LGWEIGRTPAVKATRRRADDASVEVVVTDEDREAARRSVDEGSRGVVAGAVALACVALLLSKLVTLALPESIGGFAGFVLEVGLPVALCSPLLWLVAHMAKRKYLGETSLRFAQERQAQLDAARRDFTTRLTNALEMAPTEQAALKLAEEALHRVSAVHPAEVLLADNSRAHLERVAVSPIADAPSCPVSSPDDCIAARRGHLQVFADATEIDACPRLKCRGDDVASAVCVPVSVLGRTVGVIHAANARAHHAVDIDENQTAMLQSLANQLGLRLGMIRVMSETSLAASTDSLTGLVNRRRLETTFSSLLSTGTPVSLVLADVDDFKELNDRHGHEAGDRALRAFAGALRAEVRPDDIVCRYGGEEFVVVLPRCSAEDAQRVFQRVQKRVGSIGDDGRLPRFTASYGVTDSDGTTGLDDLISEADAALYEAKADGKNRLVTRASLQAVVDIDIDDEDDGGPRRRIV